MQPWLDMDGRETGCRSCGRAAPADQLFVWTARQRTRRMDFGGPRTVGAVVRYEEVGRAHLVCADCWARLSRGAHIGEASLRRLLILVAAGVAVWLLAAWLVPQWAPNVAAAFWRNGAGGR